MYYIATDSTTKVGFYNGEFVGEKIKTVYKMRTALETIGIKKRSMAEKLSQ